MWINIKNKPQCSAKLYGYNGFGVTVLKVKVTGVRWGQMCQTDPINNSRTPTSNLVLTSILGSRGTLLNLGSLCQRSSSPVFFMFYTLLLFCLCLCVYFSFLIYNHVYISFTQTSHFRTCYKACLIKFDKHQAFRDTAKLIRKKLTMLEKRPVNLLYNLVYIIVNNWGFFHQFLRLC